LFVPSGNDHCTFLKKKNLLINKRDKNYRSFIVSTLIIEVYHLIKRYKTKIESLANKIKNESADKAKTLPKLRD